jgi:hypothetical protein
VRRLLQHARAQYYIVRVAKRLAEEKRRSLRDIAAQN